jgi:hypothetical protein
MQKLKPGTKVRSSVCDTEVMVIAAPPREIALTCGGAPMYAPGAEPKGGAALAPDASAGTQLGKRYVNAQSDLELLCTKPGKGSLACDGVALSLKGAKPLPASD